MRLRVILWSLGIGLMLVSCGGRTQEAQDAAETRNGSGMTLPEVEYNPSVESFTSGHIGRMESVSVTLTEPVDSVPHWEKYIEISPTVNGSWSLSAEDPRTLVFRPETAFERGTVYRVRMKLGKLLGGAGGESAAKDFEFPFRTFSAEASAELTTFRVGKDDRFSVEGVLYTQDSEDSAQVRKMTRWAGLQEGRVEWRHSADGRTHRFSITGVERGLLADELTLTVQDKQAGYAEQELLKVSLPGRGDFALHSVGYCNDGEQYVEVRFTDRVNMGQDLDGLVYLKDDVRSVRRVDGNLVRIYPQSSALEKDDDGQISVVLCVDGSLRNAAGERLGEDVERTVVLDAGRPAVRFVGAGTIVPPSSALVGEGDRGGRGIPFQAVGLRAVQVDVFRIPEQNVGQFLQENELGSKDVGNLMRTARPVATRTVFLDGNDSRKLRQWSTYSLDLDELVETEPGALYRIVLSFNRSMAALPCVPAEERLTPQAAQAADRARLRSMQERFDRGGYYWSGSDAYDWEVYEWKDRDNPCTPSYYYGRSAQRSLLVSDLGAIAKGSDEPRMLFMVHSLSTTEPVKGAQVELRNFQGQSLGRGTTDENGQLLVRFEGGRPYYAVVSKERQRTYLKVNAGSELSTSTFDVSGEQTREGLRGFIWTDRGVWRPGDTIYLNFTTAGMRLPEGHPASVELRSPLGQLYRKRVATRSVGGIYGFVLATDPEAPTGVWNATVSVGGATFDKRLRIETIKPNRLKIDLRFPEPYIQRGKPLDALLHGEWLTGARAGGLRYAIETEFTALRNGFERYEGYVFDNPYLAFRPENAPEITGTTDVAGDARITAVLKGGEKAGGMLQARLTTRLFEPSGEASVDATTILYSPFDSYVGIRPPAGADDQLPTGRNHRFEIATVRPDGSALGGRRVEINLYRLDWHWWWSSERNELARYVSSSRLKPVRHEEIETSSFGGTGSYTLNLSDREWGTYYMTARDLKGGHESAVLLYLDWPDYGNRHRDGEGAMRLSVSLDKPSYQAGEQATVSFPATKGSRAIVSVENGSRVVETFLLSCDHDGPLKHRFRVTPEMQPNVYLNVTLLQPYGSVENDLPVRLYGIVPLRVVSSASRLEPVIGAPDDVRPESTLTLTVSEKQGRPFAYTLAVVDEGLLDLTRFRTPDPWERFHARIALGVSTWDVYNNVLGAYGGRIEQMFAIGGDDALDPVGKPAVNRFTPVVRHLGTFRLAKGAKATHTVRLPAYMGRLRAMVVAVSQEADDGNGAWGAAERSITVRSPLMTLGSAPRAVAPGDEFVVPATLIATQDGVGTVTASIAADTALFTVVGSARQTATLDRKGDRIVLFRLRAKETLRTGTLGGYIEITARGSGGLKSHYGMDIPFRRLSTPVAEGRNYTVAAGKKWDATALLQGVPGTQGLMLEVSSVEPLGAAQRMEYLSTYPYGCVEQITSAVFPLLYLSDLADLSESERTEARTKIHDVLNRYTRYATPDGAMGYWPGASSPSAWGSAYALHFMTVAGHKGYTVPTEVYDRLRTAVKNVAVQWNASQSEALNLIQAYRLYVLALSGAPEIGAMNRLRQSERLTTETRWMLGAAYAAAERKDMGRTVVAGGTTDPTPTDDVLRRQRVATFGSPERARAIQLLGSVLLNMPAEAAQLAGQLSRRLASNEWMSTQTTAWCLLAMGEYIERTGRVSALDFEWSAAGKSGRVESTDKRMLWTGRWENPASGRLSVVNRTGGTLYVRTVATGIASGRSVAAARNGLEVSVRYTDAQGRPVEATSLAQGTDFVSEVTVRNLTQEPLSNLMLSEPVASGWEIRPDRSQEMSGVGYRDLRDDRVDSFIPELAPGGSVKVSTRLNATYAGVYTLPAIRCAAMYDDAVAGNTASATATVR